MHNYNLIFLIPNLILGAIIIFSFHRINIFYTAWNFPSLEFFFILIHK